MCDHQGANDAENAEHKNTSVSPSPSPPFFFFFRDRISQTYSVDQAVLKIKNVSVSTFRMLGHHTLLVTLFLDQWNPIPSKTYECMLTGCLITTVPQAVTMQTWWRTVSLCASQTLICISLLRASCQNAVCESVALRLFIPNMLPEYVSVASPRTVLCYQETLTEMRNSNWGSELNLLNKNEHFNKISR